MMNSPIYNHQRDIPIVETVTYPDNVVISFPHRHYVARMGATIYLRVGARCVDVAEIAKIAIMDTGRDGASCAVLLQGGEDVGSDFCDHASAASMYGDLAEILPASVGRSSIS